MPRITEAIQEKLESGDYRLVEIDQKGNFISKPGEVIMVCNGVYLAFTGNVKEKSDYIIKPNSSEKQPKKISQKPKGWLD